MGLRELEIKRSGGCGDSKNTTGLAGSACGNVKIIAVFGAAGIMVTTTVSFLFKLFVCMRAQVDNRMRAWYQKNMAVGLLYSCSLGEVHF